jgi:hypothetical protein
MTTVHTQNGRGAADRGSFKSIRTTIHKYKEDIWAANAPVSHACASGSDEPCGQRH